MALGHHDTTTQGSPAESTGDLLTSIRDLDQAAAGRVTVRLRHRQVLAEPCATAVRLARLLRSRGWTGAPRPCGPDCDVISETWSHQAATGLRDEAG